MNYSIQQTEAADENVAEQVNWYRSDEFHGGEALARRWFENLTLALDKLATAPHHYGFAPENGQWMPELPIRQMLFRPWKSGVGWRVLYTVDDLAQQVTLLQIRHEHRQHLHEVPDANDQST